MHRITKDQVLSALRSRKRVNLAFWRACFVVAALVTLPGGALAQAVVPVETDDAEANTSTTASQPTSPEGTSLGGADSAADEAPHPDEEAGHEPSPEVTAVNGDGNTAEAPKVAVVVVGDPDLALRGAARRVERALAEVLRTPFDPGLRAALRGEPGDSDDGLSEVRNVRRRLGLGEAHDAPILQQLGRRTNASALAVVRGGPEGAELVVFNVRAGAFYEGALPIRADVSERRVQRFVSRRAQVAVGPAPSPRQVAEAALESPTPAEPTEQDEEPDFFEQFWPYLVAGVLLAAMITAIAVTAATDAPDPPVLRFVPGGR